jgi:hypothetical protein
MSMAEAKRGALLPENAVGSGAVLDGEYIIKHVVAQMFDYGGKADATPALTVLYQDVTDPAVTFEQSYSAGRQSALHQSGDGKRFETISKNSNAFQWLESILKAGFPKDRVDDDVTVFDGTRIQLVNVAQPKRPGLKDQTEGKTIGLITKVVALPGQKAGPKASPTRTTAQTAPATTPAAASPSSNGSGDLTPAAIEMVQAILAEAPDNTITRVKLSTQVMLRATKDPTLKPNMLALKKLAGDPTWLVENAETGQWSTDGETVALGG